MSADTPTPGDLVRLMLKASGDLDTAQDELLRATRAHSEAERMYRMARSTAYLASSGTVGEREAHVTKSCDREAYGAHLAEGLSRAALEAVRNRRTQLSVLQTVANAVKEEAALARVGGDYR
jgi:hypothetical protein